MTKENLTFDIFAAVARVSRIMAAKAKPGALSFNKIGFPSFPSSIGVALVTVNFKNGPVSHVGFDCKATDVLAPQLSKAAGPISGEVGR
jgi:hypothetical protein